MDKVIFGFLQEEIIKIKGFKEVKRKNEIKKTEIKLDITDLLILQKVSKFIVSPKGNIINDNKIYTLVDYETILDNLPIMDITLKSISERFSKYRKLGLLEQYLRKDPILGTFTYFHITEKLANCIDGSKNEKTSNKSKVKKVDNVSTGCPQNVSTGCPQNVSTGGHKHYNNTTKNTITSFSNNYSFLKDINIDSQTKKNIDSINDLTEEFFFNNYNHCIKHDLNFGILVNTLKKGQRLNGDDLAKKKEKESQEIKKDLQEERNIEENKEILEEAIELYRIDIGVKSLNSKQIEAFNKFSRSMYIKRVLSA